MCVIRLSIYRLRREDLNFLLLLESFSTSLYFSLPYLSTPTLFSLIIIIIIVATVSNRIELNYYYYVNESTSHTTFFFYRLLSTIVTCTDTYLKMLYLLII